MASSDVISSGRKRPAAELGSATKTTQGVALTNDYMGYQPPPGIQRFTDRVSPSVAPEQFFTEYVSQRRPAVFGSQLVDGQWKGGTEWTNAYLYRKAGTAWITVEDRPRSGDANVIRTFQVEM